MRTSYVPLRFLLLLMLLHVEAPLGHAAEDQEAAAAAEVQREIDAILSQSEIGLPELFRLAELASPRLAVARAGVMAQQGRVKQAGLYPNPELELGVEEMFLENTDIHKKVVGLKQPLALGGRLGAAVDAAKADLAAADHQLRQERREAFRRVQHLWAEQLYFREAEVLFEDLSQVAQEGLDIARTRFEAQAAPESHVTRAMLELFELEVARQELAQERVRSTAEFAAFFGDVRVPLDRLGGSLDPDEEEVRVSSASDSVLAEHPWMLSARMDVAAAEASLRHAEKERFPDLNLFVAYGNFEPLDQNYVEAGLSFPLPIFHRNQGRVAETRSLITRAEYQARLVENELAIALAASIQRHDMLHEQLDTVSERIAPAAERGLDQAREAYRVGRLMFLELVDAQRNYAEARLRVLELRRDLALTEADVLSLLGAGAYADPIIDPDPESGRAAGEQS